jgi:hypothetical protein
MNKVLDIVERRADGTGLKHVFFDTPGQIEVFTWSASGMIITEVRAQPPVYARAAPRVCGAAVRGDGWPLERGGRKGKWWVGQMCGCGEGRGDHVMSTDC